MRFGVPGPAAQMQAQPRSHDTRCPDRGDGLVPSHPKNRRAYRFISGASTEAWTRFPAPPLPSRFPWAAQV